MNRPAFVVAAFLSAVPFFAQSQDSLVGKYSGNYTLQSRTGPATVAVQLDIQQHDKGKVNAVARTSGSGACDGEYAMAGTFKEKNLALRSTQKSGRAGDCTFAFKAKAEGNKLVGKTAGGRDIELAK